jgi:hypothetical protein
MLNLQEIQDSLHQEIIEAKLESFSDHWTQMVNQLTPVIVAPRSKRGRKKK